MEQTRKRQTSTKKIHMAWRIGLLLLAVVVLFNGYSLAKYFMEEEEKVPIVAKSFYFDSDLLALSTGAIPHYTLQAGVNKIAFSLMNYPDELRTSEVDITYTVTLTQNGTDVKTLSGTIAAGKNNLVPVEFTNLAPGTYMVTATATAPYSETLQARFTIVGADYGVAYTVSDQSGSPVLQVTVTTTDYAGDIVISWPAGVWADNTDPLLQDVSGQSCTIKVSTQSEYTFLFFKTNPDGDYSNDVTVSKPNS